MDDYSASFADRRLTVNRFRELTGQKRSETPELTESLAGFLTHTFPSLPERDAMDLSRTFETLLDSVSKQLRSTGIYPVKSKDTDRTLSEEEQSLVVRYSALLTWHSVIVSRGGSGEKGDMIADAAITWAERADDYRQAAIAGRVKGMVLAELQDLQGAEKALRRAIVHARRAGTMAQQALVLADLGMLLILRGKANEALHAVENGNSLLRHEVKGEIAPRIRALLALVRGAIHEAKQEYSRGIAVYRKALALTHDEKHPDLQAEIYYRLSRIYYALDDDRRALDEGLNASRILEKLGEVTELGFVRVGLATTYQRLGDFPNALDALERTSECVTVPGSPLHLEYLIRKGNILSQQSRYDEAEETIESAVALARQKDEVSFIPTALTLLAEIAMKREDYHLAEERYDELIETFAHSPIGTLRLRNARAKAILEQGRLDQASEILSTLEREAREYPTEHVQLLRNRARLHEMKAEFREALRFERDASKIERQMTSKRARTPSPQNSTAAEVEALELELDAEKERRQRVERQLVAAMVDIGDQKEAITGAVEELEELAVRKEGDAALCPEFAGELRRILQTLALPDQGHSSTVSLYDKGDDEGFFNRLRARAPELTNKQERLCGLLRAGMGPKDIERIMDLKPEGLKAIRKRVRKSLNLRRGQSLEKFIREI